MTRIVGSILALLLVFPTLASADTEKDKRGTPTEQFRALNNEHYKAWMNHTKAFEEAKTEEEKNKALQERNRVTEKFTAKLLAFAEEYPKDPIAIHALVSLANVLHFPGDETRQDRLVAKSFAILKRDHVMSENVGFFCAVMSYRIGPEDHDFLRSVLEKNPHKKAQGLACLTLAQKLKESAGNNEKLLKVVEELFERAEANYAFVKVPAGGTVGARAKAELFELRCIGKEAPEIVGEDHDGKEFKLSDYKGKVVLIDFWWSTCRGCRAMWPHQRSLVKKMEGKPFVILGINTDPSKEALKKVIEKEKITWRSWWDSSVLGQGPIASKWNLSVGGTLYVIDHKGIIRHKWLHKPSEADMDKAIEKLVAEAGKADIKVSK